MIPGRSRICLPIELLSLSHFQLAGGWQLEGGALGYPTHSLSTLQPLVGYPSTLLKCCRATVKGSCARILTARGRLITFASGHRICSRQMHTEARYPVRGENVLGGRSGLVSDLRCLFENGNSKKFSQYFLSKLSFDKLSWLIVICLRQLLDFC